MRNALILATPFFIQVTWLGVFTVLRRFVYPKLAPDPRGITDAERAAGAGKPSYVGEYGRALGKWGWVRRVELGYILWLFPVMLPAMWLGRRDTCPRWVILAAPALYTLLLYLAVVHRS